tara:strand:+ start:29 stop:451 length:423 start_codon:yes stop_codon:yes gene_type:complete
MHYRKLTYLLILTILLCAGCSEGKNHKEYFPGKNGEKPTDFVYSFQKDYKLAEAEALIFLNKVEIFAEKNSMYEGENTEDLKGFVSKYYVAGPPMKFLLKIVQLDASAYRLQISNYPGRECTLCRDFSSSIDSELSAANQ